MLFENFVSTSDRKSCRIQHISIDIDDPEHPSIFGGKITNNIITLDVVCLAPGAHHKGIVIGNDGNNINALCFNLGQVLDVSGEVIYGARRRKSTWITISLMYTSEGSSEVLTRHRKQDHLLVGPFFRSIVVYGYSTGSDIAFLLRPRDVSMVIERYR